MRVAARRQHYYSGRLIEQERWVDDIYGLTAMHRGPSYAKSMSGSGFISTARSALAHTMWLGMSFQFLKRQRKNVAGADR
jgi:hypothetical protein